MSENPSIGPWRASPGDDLIIVDAKFSSVASVCPTFGKAYYRARANARLIAAAPEMLAALMRIVDIRTCDEIVPAFEEAKKAIAKATGGEI